MPRVKRRAHRRRREWTEGRRLQLLRGRDFIGDGFGNGEAFDADLAREAWAEIGGELLAEHVRERPGTRPWGWWLFESRERRRRVGTMRFKRGIGPENPRRFDPTSREFVSESAFPRGERAGYWRKRYPTADASALERFDAAFAVYESECDYLDRLGLLVAGEREAEAVLP